MVSLFFFCTRQGLMPLDLPFPSLDGGQNDSFTWVTRGVKWAGPPTQKKYGMVYHARSGGSRTLFGCKPSQLPCCA